jgi:pSer/pThr/pTyr-binding forkhead associated (FHA) protein
MEIFYKKTPHESEISWNFPCPRAIHQNGQILIFEVPYKYTKNSLRGC